MRIILIHGFGCDGSDWAAQRPSLDRLADVIALDLPGESHVGHRTGSLIETMAEAVNDVRRSASPAHVVLVGHSMGCRIALEAARRLPGGVAGFILVEGSLRAVGDPDEAVRRCRDHSDEENKASLCHDFADMFSPATPRAFRDLVMHRIEAMDATFAARLMADMTRWDAANAAEAVRAVQAPVMAVQTTHKEPGGKRRPINAQDTPPWLRLIGTETRNRAEIVRLTGLGHFPHVEAPDIINNLIESFVGRLLPMNGASP